MAVKMSVAEVTSTIKSCIISRKGGIPINEINDDYRELVGESIPFRKFGFDDLQAFLKTLPDIRMSGSVNGVPVLTAGGEKVAHIAQMINKQRSAPQNRRRKKSSRVPSGKVWQQRKKRYSFDKSPKGKYPKASESIAKQPVKSIYDKEIRHGGNTQNKLSVYSKPQSDDHYEPSNQIYDDTYKSVEQNVNSRRRPRKHNQKTNRKEMGQQPYNEDFYHNEDQYTVKQPGSVPKPHSELLNNRSTDWEVEQQHWFESLGQDASAKQYLDCIPSDRYEQYYRRYWNRCSNESADNHYDAGRSSNRSCSTNSPGVTDRKVKMVGSTLTMTVKNCTDSDKGAGDTGRKKHAISLNDSEVYQVNEDWYTPVFAHHQLIGDDFFLHLASKTLKSDCEYRYGMLHRCGLCISGQTIRDCRLQVLQSQGIAPNVLLLVGAVDILLNMTLVEMKLDMIELLDVLEMEVESVMVLTIPPLINVEKNRHLYKQILNFNKWLWSMHKDGRLQVIDIWPPFASENDGIDYEQFERSARRIPGADSSIVLWNRWGRESVLEYIALELGFPLKT